MDVLPIPRQSFACRNDTALFLLELDSPAAHKPLSKSKRTDRGDMAEALVEYQTGGLAFELSGKDTTLPGHQTPLF